MMAKVGKIEITVDTKKAEKALKGLVKLERKIYRERHGIKWWQFWK